jgi:hypothetical protein
VNTAAYNLVWLGRDFPLDDAPVTPPIASKALTDNLLAIAENNAGVDVKLWVDSKKLTPLQYKSLCNLASKAKHHNLQICDLRREIPEYNTEFYNTPDTNPEWKWDNNSTLWRQLDAVRILTCVHTAKQGYKQVVYSDLDVDNVRILTPEFQEQLGKQGMVVAIIPHRLENGMFGFISATHLEGFTKLYNDTLEYFAATASVDGGYAPFESFVRSFSPPPLREDQDCADFPNRHDPLDDMVFPITQVGNRTEHYPDSHLIPSGAEVVKPKPPKEL